MSEEQILANDNTGSQEETNAVEAKETVAETTEANAQNDTEATKTGQEGEKETKPTEYTDFALPEGFAMNSEQLEAFKPYATELGMNQEQAQKAIDMHVQGMQKAFEAEVEFRQKAYGDVVKELTADKAIGKEGIGKINAMLTKYGGEEAKGFLDVAVMAASGMSKDAAKGFMQAMHKIATAAGDAPIITGQTQAKNVADKYPGLPQNK